MKKMLSAPVIFLVICMLSGCIRYYKTSDLNKRFSSASVQISKIITQAENDYKKRKAIYDAVIKNIENPQIAPYPFLKADLDKMTAGITNIKKHRAAMNNHYNNYKTLSKGKKKIRSDKPEWDKLQSLRDKVDDTFNDSRRDLKKYQKAARSYNSNLNRYKISKVDTLKIRKKIKDYTKQVTSTIMLSKQNITEAESYLANAESQGHDSKLIREKREILKTMENILKNIEVKNTEMDNLSKKFEKEAGSKKNFWAGPGMTTHTILTDIQKKGMEINSLGQQFSSLGKKFSARQKKK